MGIWRPKPQWCTSNSVFFWFFPRKKAMTQAVFLRCEKADRVDSQFREERKT